MKGRKPKLDRPARLSVKIPSSLVNELEARTYDPGTGRIPYSARADVISKLLKDYFRGQDGARYHRLVRNLVQAEFPTEKQTALEQILNFYHEVEHETQQYESDTKLDLSELMG